ncbi:MAG: glycosyl transferase family 1 [Boseongicola sp.]|nr:glycosyl transferase family 1 [Boseongicola sp.]
MTPTEKSKEREPAVLVIIAVFEPNFDFLAEQIASIADQSHPADHVVAVIAYGKSSSGTRKLLSKHGFVFTIVDAPLPSPSYKSFELGLATALEIAPEDAVFALSDQDDIWASDKITKSLIRLKSCRAELVHSDTRVVDSDGRQIRPSLHRAEKRSPRAQVGELLIENSVTGMTVLMSRRVVETALPFPAQSAMFFHHDLWLALVASAIGKCEFIDEPLVDYRQHGENVVGAKTTPEPSFRIGSKDWFRDWAGRYAIAVYLAKCLAIRIERLQSDASAFLTPVTQNQLAPYLSRSGIGLGFFRVFVRSLSRFRIQAAWCAVMFACVGLGKFAWATREALFPDLLPQLTEFDRKLFSQAPGAQPGTVEQIAPAGGAPNEPTTVPSEPAHKFQDTRTIRRFDVSINPSRPPGFAIMVPTLNPSEMFAGIATALDVGVGLAQAGIPVQFIATDLPIRDASQSRAFIFGRAGTNAASISGLIDVTCGRKANQIALSPLDRLFATAWWTAHLAQDMISNTELVKDHFYYLIQDFEPGFYPWGAEYAAAMESYQFQYRPIFNSEPLARYFSDHGICPNMSSSAVFRPSIDIDRYLKVPRKPGKVPRLAVYGRPEVARNLFPTAVTSLDRFLVQSDFGPDDIELVSVGMVHPDIDFRTGHRLKSLGKIPWDDYPDFLGTVDFGLSLMLSPHPSHPPLEMAAAGVRVVTNHFGPKNLGAVAPALISTSSAITDVVEGLKRAVALPPVCSEDRVTSIDALGKPLGEVVHSIASAFEASEPVELAKAG